MISSRPGAPICPVTILDGECANVMTRTSAPWIKVISPLAEHAAANSAVTGATLAIRCHLPIAQSRTRQDEFR